MKQPASVEGLRDQFLRAMLESTAGLVREGPDREVTLQALIAAAGLLRERFEQELAELRVEEVE